jgi:hypothetical protein
MKIHIVCKEDCDWSWPVAAYKHKGDAEKHNNTLNAGQVYEMELIRR